jgi:hypothetical protein
MVPAAAFAPVSPADAASALFSAISVAALATDGCTCTVGFEITGALALAVSGDGEGSAAVVGMVVVADENLMPP